jgi:crotonobetainyl-CoA:carnitine CoA-transferase CaiB-like acyl-CoA transferase
LEVAKRFPFTLQFPAPVEPSPLLGEHTTEVFGEWLDISAGDVATLRDEGVV